MHDSRQNVTIKVEEWRRYGQDVRLISTATITVAARPEKPTPGQRAAMKYAAVLNIAKSDWFGTSNHEEHATPVILRTVRISP